MSRVRAGVSPSSYSITFERMLWLRRIEWSPSKIGQVPIVLQEVAAREKYCNHGELPLLPISADTSKRLYSTATT